MNRILLSALTAGAIALGALSLPAQAAVNVDITVAPPVAPVEVVPAPRPGYVWAPGYWRWEGHRHVWIGGHWLAQRPGHIWVPDRWEQRGPHYHYMPGHWNRR